jgi:hypothetical protein
MEFYDLLQNLDYGTRDGAPLYYDLKRYSTNDRD